MRGSSYVVRDVESSLPPEQTLPERRRERCPVKRHASTLILAAATVALIVGCAVLAMIGSRVLTREMQAPRCTEDMLCWQPALMGNGRGHVSPFILQVDR